MTVAIATELSTGTWAIDPVHSSVNFSVRHLMVSKVRGHFGVFSGAITVAEDGTPSVSAEIDVTSLSTGNDQRDAHVKSADFFDAEKFPTATFRSTAVRANGDDYVVDGDFTLKGITKPVSLALEFNGDLYSCDHYVYPRWKLGNVMNKALGDMVMSPEQRAFGQKKETTLPRQCRECPVKFACHGECPKHRFMRTAEGEPGLNYLCPSYKHFFAHVDKPMKVMAELLRRERAPAEIMRLYRENLPLAPASLDIAPKAPGRNDPCPCGSGKKFKQCHGA